MSDQIIVRFPPSPTGPLHIGGVRTALYNYLFAKKHGGKLILRIEDTDQNRYVSGAEEYIIESLKWLGITFDEGVGIGGPNGPYRQSERSELYRKYAWQLVDAGKAYLAFDTEEEIEAMRERLRAEGHKATAQYNFATRKQMKNSLTLSKEEVKTRLDAGEPYVIRTLVPRKEEIRFHDEVRDWVVVHSSQLDDKILLKSDGLPTYHLANVVDDHHMGISHVIRGEEWLPSTPLHVLLYRALGWESVMPKFVHLPLILKPSGNGKLSKRDGVEGLIDDLAKKGLQQYKKQNGGQNVEEAESEAVKDFARSFIAQYKGHPEAAQASLVAGGAIAPVEALKSYLETTFFSPRGLNDKDKERLSISVFPIDWEDPKTHSVTQGLKEMGFLPEAMLNFLVLLGWNPGSDEEVMNLDRMIESFSLDRIHKAGARFDSEKLKWFNQLYIREADAGILIPMVKEALHTLGYDIPDEDYLSKAIDLMRERVTFPREIVADGGFLFATPDGYDAKMAKKRWKDNSGKLLAELMEKWELQENWLAGNLEQAFSDYIEENDLGKGSVLAPLRLALTGASAGPGVFEIAELIGRDETMHRIEKAQAELAIA